MKNKWPLNVDSFSFLDKLKICYWLLTEEQWTQGKWVEKYEKTWEEFLGNRSHAIMVSSGSTANELIALRAKWQLEQNEQWPKRNKVIVSSTTWISNISPFVNIGFEPVFVDIDINTLCADLKKIREVLENDVNKEISVVNYTTLVGKSGNLDELTEICKTHKVKLVLDNCESSFSKFKGEYFSNYATSSTSIYFSHLTTSGTEGGLIFCKDEEEYEWYKMMRSHGMTRGMPEKYKNKEVDSMFDFCYMGSNYRSSNLQAYMALLNFKKGVDFCEKRRLLAYNFDFATGAYSALADRKFHLPYLGDNCEFVPFCLIYIGHSEEQTNKLKSILKENGIEFRPIISGNLLRQTAFKKYGINPENFPNSEYIHKYGLYLGLHNRLSTNDIAKLSLIVKKSYE